QHLDVLGLVARVCQAIARRRDGERERVLAGGADAALADPRQRFEVDVGMVRRALEQRAGREAPLRQLQPETLEAAPVRDPGAEVLAPFDEHPVLNSTDVLHDDAALSAGAPGPSVVGFAVRRFRPVARLPWRARDLVRPSWLALLLCAGLPGVPGPV